jgi:hypothetical protein
VGDSIDPCDLSEFALLLDLAACDRLPKRDHRLPALLVSVLDSVDRLLESGSSTLGADALNSIRRKLITDLAATETSPPC